MNENIAENIREILAQTGSVIIPNLGRFTAQYKSSVIDNIQGQLNAPSFDIAFDPNVRINDGILADKISRIQHISIQEAQTQLDDYVQDANHLINQHEPFAIPEVGKIYQDTSGKIQFISFNQNINLDSFGLPTVSFQPISRSSTNTSVQEPNSNSYKKDLVMEKKTNGDASNVSTTSSKDIYITSGVEEESKIFGLERTTFWRTFITTSLILSALAIAGLTLMNKDKPNVPEKVAIEDSSNIPATSEMNKNSTVISTPSAVASDSSMLYTGNTSSEKAAAALKTKTENTKTVQPMKKEKPAKEPVVVAPENKATKSNSATIIIGGFGNANNIAKLRKWITQHNYEVYEQPKGDLKIIGAVVHYDSKEELNKIVAQFKERYGYEIEVKK